MNTVRNGTQWLVLALLSLVSVGAYATPISGSLSMGGSFTLVDGSGNPSDLAGSTGIDFSPAGANGVFVVTGTTGDFSSISMFTQGQITDFQFAPFSGPINDFWSLALDGFSFDLNTLDSVTKTSVGSSDFISMTGTGTINTTIAGLDATSGEWSLSGDSTTGIIFGWSSTTTAQVPEPSTIALMGIAMLGVGLVRLRTVRRCRDAA